MQIPEQWKRYKDTDYYVSDQGRIIHKLKNGKEREIFGTRWRDYKCKGSPQMVARVGSRHQKLIKNIVWETFKGEKPKGLLLVHKNGLYRDNSLYNLELMTPQECGRKYGGMTPRARKIINLDTGAIYRGIRGAGKGCFCSYQTITDICNGKVKRPCVNVFWWDGEKAYRGEYKYEEY